MVINNGFKIDFGWRETAASLAASASKEYSILYTTAFKTKAVATVGSLSNYVFTYGTYNDTKTGFTFGVKNQNTNTQSTVNSYRWIAIGY